MKHKIKNFSKGNFEVEKPDITFSETNLILHIGEGEQYKGSFRIENTKEGDIRGLVYPSSFRVHFAEQGFEGNPVQVDFTYDGTGLEPGFVEKGTFTVVCNGGEYDIAFTAIVGKPYIMSEYGKIHNLSEFKNLAMKDFQEARKLFYSHHFYEILKYEEERITHLYTNIRKWSLDERALEEFLVGINLKERIFLTFAEEESDFVDLLESEKGTITVSKNTWGYMPIKIYAEGEFLHLNKELITTDDFVGNEYYLEFVVTVGKLHAGYNFGKIILETPYGKVEHLVNVSQRALREDGHENEELIFAQLIKSYMGCVSGKTSLAKWTDMAEELVKELKKESPDNEYYELLQAHIYLRGGRAEDARWILEQFNFSKFSIGRKRETESYYLFLMALLKKDAAYTKKVVEELHKAYAKNPYSWRLLCMLLNLDPKYKNYAERLIALKEQFDGGANQMLLYIEAYICFQEKSALLTKLGEFELQILNFATKYRMITKELALLTANLASQEKGFHPWLYQILTRSYAMYSEQMILTAICTLLIKGNKMGNEYFKWYEKAVKEELKIARLYEYYMASIQEKKMKKSLPKTVYLYFMHGNSLDYKKTAFLYANILSYEDEDGEIYRHYREEMEAFAWKQLEQGRINDSLRILYRRFVTKEELTGERMQALNRICHTYHISTKVPNIKYVLVIEKDGNVTYTPYGEDGADIVLYDKEPRIVWETVGGNHYVGSVQYDIRRLFYEPSFLEMCKGLQKEEGQEEAKQAVELTMENLRTWPFSKFKEENILLFISKAVREIQGEEDEFLLWACFALLKEGYYDKTTLHYLTKYYCGATKNMKLVSRTAEAYELETSALSERILTQMIFSEELCGDEDVLEDYCKGKTYFRLKQGYYAYVSHEYVIRDRLVKGTVFHRMLEELKEGESLADVCKIATLKYFADHPVKEEQKEALKELLREMYEDGYVFPFYLSYEESWLRELQLHDKVVVQYRASQDGKVRISYQINRTDESKAVVCTQTEVLSPVYENIYTKSFTIYRDESLKYYFKESVGRKTIASEKSVLSFREDQAHDGKYGKINRMLMLSGEELIQAAEEYDKENTLADELFLVY